MHLKPLSSLFIALTLLFHVVPAHSQQPGAQTGSYILEGTLPEILGARAIPAYEELIDVDQTNKWEITVPENYDPANPPGVIVYISPQDTIKIPSGWLDVTDKMNLIWIAALKSGNKVPANERMVKAMLPLAVIQSNYKINPERVYITGFSGGGRVASLAATYYPGIFKGAIYNCGANFWNQENPEQIEQIKQNRFVFLTGSQDFNLNDTKNIYAKYKKAGAKNIKLMVVNRMGHANPKRRKFAQALEYLDER